MSFNVKFLVSFVCLAVLAMPASNLVAQEQGGGIPGIKPAAIATEMSDEEAIKKASMIIVYNQLGPIVAQMKSAGIELDKEQAEEGLRRLLAGEPLGITPEQARPIMMPLQKKMMAFQQQRQQEMMTKMKEMADKNKAEGDAFMAENAKKEGVKTLEGGVQYEVMVAGSGPKTKQNSKVKINYHGMFPDGRVFDSTTEARPGKTPGPVELNSGIFVPGFKTALHQMPEGSKWKIVIPGSQAYGMRGQPPVIPPNQTLVFELELLKVYDPVEGAGGE